MSDGMNVRHITSANYVKLLNTHLLTSHLTKTPARTVKQFSYTVDHIKFIKINNKNT